MTALPARTLALCVPDLDLSFHWTMFLHHAGEIAPTRRWRLHAMPVAATAAQAEAIAHLALGPGDVLALRPLAHDQAALAAPLQRLHEDGVRIVLLGELDSWHGAVLRADQAGGLALAVRAAMRLGTPRQLVLLGAAPHALVTPAQLAPLAPQARLRAAAPCLSSLPEDLHAHGRAELERLHAAAPLAPGDAVLAVDDHLALGAADALAALGLGDSVYVAGTGATPAALLAMGAGRLRASAYVDPLAWLDALFDWCDADAGDAGEPAPALQPACLLEAHGVAGFRARHEHAHLQLLDQAIWQLRSTRQAAAFMESVVENMPAMLFVKRMPDLRFHLVNKAREQWLGMPRERIIGRTAYDFNSAEIADLYTQRDREVLARGAIVDQPVVPVRLASGEQRYVLTRKIPLLDANGQPAFLVGISIDVTERELVEQDLARRKAELEQAHAALKENQHKLLVSEKMAALGRLTAGIAHEMNTPLAAIRAAMAELVALADELAASAGDDAVTDEDVREIAAEMRQCAQLAAKSAERAAGFVRSVKHHTRNHGADEKVAFDAVQVAQESILLLDHLIKGHRCTVTLEHPPERLELLGAPGGFAQILTNLISNALDACPADGAGRVALCLRPAGAVLCVSVGDNGTGIAPANLARIFDPMFTTKPFGHGTGLGLSIVHDIVHDQFGGRIDVTSTPGAGTMFELAIPFAPEAPTATT